MLEFLLSLSLALMASAPFSLNHLQVELAAVTEVVSLLSLNLAYFKSHFL